MNEFNEVPIHENHMSDDSDISEDDVKLAKKAYNHAIKLLAKKDYSRFKLSQKLYDKGFEKDLVEPLMDELIERKYLREDLYKEARIKGLFRKGYNPKVISYRLSQEQCYATVHEIEDILFEHDLISDNQAYEVVSKKVRLEYDFVTDKEKLRQKVLRYAVSRGHSIGDASDAYKRVIAEYSDTNSF